MTRPLPNLPLPTRTAAFRPAGVPTASMPSASQSGSAQARWSAPQARPSADHLALVQALIEAGQLTRAMELLDVVWHHDLLDEHCWYLRLWLLTAQGRVAEALELTRQMAGQLPGSAAIAYLHSALERAAGDPQAAVEAALRASVIAPGRAETEALLELVLEEHGAASTGDPALQPLRSPSEVATNPVAAALAGLTLLHPQGSALSFRPTLPAIEPPVPTDRQVQRDSQRIWLIGGATVLAAIWAVRDPLLASAALAAVVAWLSRSGRSTSA